MLRDEEGRKVLDTRIRVVIDPTLNAIASRLVETGITANRMSVAGFVLGLGCGFAVLHHEYGLALVYLLLSRLADGLDGAIARHQTPTAFGGYLDIVCDFIFYSLIPLCFALSHPEHAAAASFLIFSFVGTGCSFLAYAILQAQYPKKQRLSSGQQKSFYYLGGLTEGTETIALFVLFLLFPDSVSVLAWIFGSLCWMTTAFRIRAAWVDFGKDS